MNEINNTITATHFFIASLEFNTACIVDTHVESLTTESTKNTTQSCTKTTTIKDTKWFDEIYNSEGNMKKLTIF